MTKPSWFYVTKEEEDAINKTRVTTDREIPANYILGGSVKPFLRRGNVEEGEMEAPCPNCGYFTHRVLLHGEDCPGCLLTPSAAQWVSDIKVRISKLEAELDDCKARLAQALKGEQSPADPP